MFIDSKPREFSYLKHKNNFPLELSGNMKRKVRFPSQPSRRSCTFDPNQKENLAIQMANTRDCKSILPFEMEQSKRRHSIKTYERQKYMQVSGAAYLMVKSNAQPDHSQKKHFADQHLRHSGSRQDQRREKKHFDQNEMKNSNETERHSPIKCSQTLYQKLNEIYSRIESKQSIGSTERKKNSRNLFVQGVDLGYDQHKQREVSRAKRREIAGSANIEEQPHRRVYREDWRKSSICLG